MKPACLIVILVGALGIRLTEAGYSRPEGADEDDFAGDVAGYGSPGFKDPISAAGIPSQAPKSSVRPSGYARPEISQDEDWDFDVKPPGGNQRGVGIATKSLNPPSYSDGWSSGGSNYGPTVAPRRPAAPYGPSKLPPSAGWVASNGHPAKGDFGSSGNAGWSKTGSGPNVEPERHQASYGPARQRAAGGWSPNNLGNPGGWTPSNSLSSQDFPDGWTSSGPTIAPKRASPSYGPGSAANRNNGWSANNAGGGWSPMGSGPTVAPKRPQTSYGPGNKAATGGGWSDAGGSKSPFGPAEGSYGWSRAESGPTVAPKRTSAPYGPSSNFGGNGGWSQSTAAKSNFGTASGSNPGGGWGETGPTVAPRRPQTSYGPVSKPAAAGGWSAHGAGGSRSNFGPAPSSKQGGGWNPQNAGPTVAPKRPQTSYGPQSSFPVAGNINSGKSWEQFPVGGPTVAPKRNQASYGPSVNPATRGSWSPSNPGAGKASHVPSRPANVGGSWFPAGPTVAPRRPQASYAPAGKQAAPGGWSGAGTAKTSFAPSGGHSSSAGWSAAGAGPSGAPERTPTSYGPSNGGSWSPSGSNAATPAFGAMNNAGAGGWTAEEDQPNNGAHRTPSSYGAAKTSFAPTGGRPSFGGHSQQRAQPAPSPRKPSSSYGEPAQPTPAGEGWSANDAAHGPGHSAPGGWSDAGAGLRAQQRPSSAYGSPTYSGDAHEYQNGHSGAAMPYEFSYNADLNDGNIYREEKGDDTGKVVGIYTIRTNDGIDRKVKYFADQSGFHAEVDTNEPGTASKNPADVIIRSTASQDAHEATGAHGGNDAPSYDRQSQLANARAQGGGVGGGYANPNAGGWEEE